MMKHKIRNMMAPLLSFVYREADSGRVLLVSAIIAVLIANSPLGPDYEHLLHSEIALPGLSMSLAHWINDGLMAVFFFVIGLEVKREFLYGELKTRSAMVMPVCAALGGMIVPALLYSAVNFGLPTSGGWGIPMATDIAFALGVLALAAGDAPIGFVVFLTALAIVDDLGAIVVIALFYSSDVSVAALGAGLAVLALAYLLNRRHVQTFLPYLVLGLCAWYAFLLSGIHPTIAGVLLGFTIPAERQKDDDMLHGGTEQADHHGSLLHVLEEKLELWSSYGIMPIFALANAGVAVSASSFDPTSPIFLGIVAGLVLGKPLGIYGSVWLLTKVSGAHFPGGASHGQTLAAGTLGGIGFTMSIFIATLALPDPVDIATAKISILSASILAGILGALLFRVSRKQTNG